MEVLDVPVELAENIAEIEDAIVEKLMPAGRARLTAVRDRAVLRVAGVGSFAVERGRRIRFAREDGARPDVAARWLGSTVATLLLAQRSQFALHASVVVIGGAGVAVCGERGAGKSTTVLRLAQRGHILATDDVSALTLGDEVLVQPLAHPVRVLPDSAERLGLDTSSARRVPSQPKLVLPAPEGRPLRLAAIVVLGCGTAGEVSCAPLRGADACWAVVRNTHRGDVYRALWEAEMFAWAGRVTSRVPVCRVTRPRDGWTVDEVADAVQRTAASAV